MPSVRDAHGSESGFLFAVDARLDGTNLIDGACACIVGRHAAPVGVDHVRVVVNEAQQGVAIWYDDARQRLACVSVDAGANEKRLTDLAQQLYVLE